MVGSFEFGLIQESRTRIAETRHEIDLLHIKNHELAHNSTYFDVHFSSSTGNAELHNLLIQKNSATIKVKKHEIKQHEHTIQSILDGPAVAAPPVPVSAEVVPAPEPRVKRKYTKRKAAPVPTPAVA